MDYSKIIICGEWEKGKYYRTEKLRLLKNTTDNRKLFPRLKRIKLPDPAWSFSLYLPPGRQSPA
jgi:hypothetical protein